MQDVTLCYPIREGSVLMMEKRRGVGAGFLNAPGGKVEPAETVREGVVREVREELRVDVADLERVGELEFTFGADADPRFRCHVYRTETVTGEPERTPEAMPEWHPVDDLPYHRMWESDRVWVPYALAGRTFTGEIVFDEDGDDGDLLRFAIDLTDEPGG